MQWRTFIIGWILAVAVLLFARRPSESQAFGFRQVVDLTHNGALVVRGEHLDASAFGTRMDAPIHPDRGGWAAEPVSPDRLVAPLAVIDVSARAARDPQYQVSVGDIAAWEQVHGHIPAGAVVIAHTGWQMPTALPKQPLPHAAFSTEAAEFLVRARTVYGVGIDAPGLDLPGSTDMPVRRYLGQFHVYGLANVAHADEAPASGAVLVVGPTVIQNAAGAPVRLLALVR